MSSDLSSEESKSSCTIFLFSIPLREVMPHLPNEASLRLLLRKARSPGRSGDIRAVPLLVHETVEETCVACC